MPIYLIKDRRLNRWIVLFGIGLICLLLFIMIAFAAEFLVLMHLIDMQVAAFFHLAPSAYNPKLKVLIFLAIASALCLVVAGAKIVHYLVGALMPEKKGQIMSILRESSKLSEAPHIVVIGGGTGLNSILSGLKKYTGNLTAIVSVADEGKSSRILRYEFGVLPPGDIRNCLVALSESSPMMARLLQYRFKEGKGLKGHAFGNLLITAMTRITGSFEAGLLETEKLLAIKGRVLPVSLDKTSLCATLENGKVIREEPNVEAHKRKYRSEIKKLYLDPQATVYGEAQKAIAAADLIVIGPGSLYTSIIPNLLVKGIPEAIARAKAPTVYVCNVMTQPGETDGYPVSKHVARVVEYLGKGELDYVVANSEMPSESIVRKYRAEGSEPVLLDIDSLRPFNVNIVKANLLSRKDLLRHDSDKLARVVLGLCGK